MWQSGSSSYSAESSTTGGSSTTTTAIVWWHYKTLSLVLSPGINSFLWLDFTLVFLIFDLYIIINIFSWRIYWSKGFSLGGMQGGGVEHSDHLRLSIYPAKIYGSWPLGDYGQDHGRFSINYIKKRSLRRVYRRLDTYGYTWYRDQFWQKYIALLSKPIFISQPKTRPLTQPLEHIPRNRLIIYRWNGRALSSARYHKLL